MCSGKGFASDVGHWSTDVRALSGWLCWNTDDLVDKIWPCPGYVTGKHIAIKHVKESDLPSFDVPLREEWEFPPPSELSHDWKAMKYETVILHL